MNVFSYKRNEDSRKAFTRKQNMADENLDQDSIEYDDEQISACSKNITSSCIELMDNGKSPLAILKFNYGDNAPIFNILFLQKFIQFFNFAKEKDYLLTYYITNGPIENATRLLKHDFFNILFADMPNNFPIFLHLLSKTTKQGITKFIETGGIYVLCYFILDPKYTLIISQLLYIISDTEIDYFSDILPPNAFYPIKCNFETTLIFTFKDFIEKLLLIEDIKILNLLILSLKNIFHQSEKAIHKLGNIVFENLFIKRQLLLNPETLILIPDLVELFNILSNYFDFDFFRIDMIGLFYILIETNDFNQKVSLVPSFLSLIDNIPMQILPSILGAKTLQILEDLIHIENNISFLPNIIETVSDIATKILMYDEEYQYSLRQYIHECTSILNFLCDHDDDEISKLAESTILVINKITLNYQYE